MKDLIAKLKTLDGAADLAAEFEAAWTQHTGALDAAKAEARKAAKDAKAATAERDTLKADLDAAKAGESEQIAALTAARDEAIAARDAAAAEFKQHRIHTELGQLIGLDGPKREAALKLGDWSGVDLDDAGKLVGAEEPLKALKTAHDYLFAPGPAQGNGGRPAGAQPAPRPAGQTDPKEALREAGRAAARATLEGTVPSLLRPTDNAAA